MSTTWDQIRTEKGPAASDQSGRLHACRISRVVSTASRPAAPRNAMLSFRTNSARAIDRASPQLENRRYWALCALAGFTF